MTGPYQWQSTRPPKSAQLTGVESHGTIAFAAGSQGLLTERRGPGDWRALVSEGPTGNGHNLNDAAVTDGGSRLWYCGDSGALGYYDRERSEAVPHSAPDDLSNGFTSVTVAGLAGEEVVHAVDDSGYVVYLTMRGTELTLEDASMLGDGSELTEVVEDGATRYISDASGKIFRSDDGVNWRSEQLVETTIEGLAVADTGLAAVTDDGRVFRDIDLFGEDGRRRRADLGDVSPEDVTAAGESFVVVGDDGYVAHIDAAGQLQEYTPSEARFYSGELMDDGTILAAGSDGTIAEGSRGE